jgi:hypothetical protein
MLDMVEWKDYDVGCVRIGFLLFSFSKYHCLSHENDFMSPPMKLLSGMPQYGGHQDGACQRKLSKQAIIE